MMPQEEYFLKQKPKIVKQIEFAKKHVPFFQDLLKDTDVNKIETYKDFCDSFPIIKTSQVVENPKFFCSDQPVEFIRHSSSTTGKPKKVFLTKDDLELWAKESRLSITPYFKQGMVVAFSRRKEQYYLSSLNESVILSGGKTVTFDPNNIEELVNCIKKADIVLDYAEMIYYISERLKDLNMNLNKELIISYTGNILENLDIEKIKCNFKKAGIKTEVFSEYATTEIGPIGCSDKTDQNRFEIIYDNICFIEVINPKTNKPDEHGEIVITTLGRTGSVFIRYKVGDIGKLFFENNKTFFVLEKRKSDIKVASVCFSPEQAFRTLRRLINSPIFCEINLYQNSFFSKILINIFCEKSIKDDDKQEIKEKLATDLELIDDLGITAALNLNYHHYSLNENQIRKGFRFRKRNILMSNLMKLIRKDMKEISENLGRPDIYFEETRTDNGTSNLMPLVALKTNPCTWLKNCGGCTNCGYQLVASLSQSPTDEDLIKQTEYAIGAVPSKHYPLITFNSAGSFLNPLEISDELRPQLLKMLRDAGYKELNFECRPEFLLHENRVKQLKEYFDTVSIGIGLESTDDYIRNECVHKGTKIETYLKAINLLKKHNIDGDVYIQLGKPFLTAKEDIEDACRTAMWAFENGFTRVFLMLCNIQPFTLTHYLWKKGKFELPMLWRGVEVLKRLPENYKPNTYVKGFNRAVPTPIEFPHNCEECNSIVADKLIHWNLTGDFNHIKSMPNCECLQKFNEDLSKIPTESLQERVETIKQEVWDELNC